MALTSTRFSSVPSPRRLLMMSVILAVAVDVWTTYLAFHENWYPVSINIATQCVWLACVLGMPVLLWMVKGERVLRVVIFLGWICWVGLNVRAIYLVLYD